MNALIGVAGDGEDLSGRVRPLVDGWRLVARGPWYVALPPDGRMPEQGWKLHLPATVTNAGDVLARAVPVLAGHGCAFKFAATTRTVRMLGSRDCDRSGAGKFLTAYPRDDDHFRTLADDLDHATRGLSGPPVLSDRVYRPGSLVHYRYGGFTGRSRLDNDGTYRQVLTAPDGTTVDDERDRFAPPPWATVPLPAPSTAAPAPAGRRRVLLAGRFTVAEAVRHSVKGGVFLGEDTAGEPGVGPAGPVVVKQARPHTECDSSGRDSRDLLRNEERMLALLAPLGLAPAPVALFEQDGHVFLAEERVDGPPLRRWVEQRGSGRAGPPAPDALRMALHLADAVAAVHRLGIVLRDLSPTNVVVTADGRPVLVDLELAAFAAGPPARRGGTPGYQAPEQAGDPRDRTPAHVSEDLFSLGGLYFLLATGTDPLLPDDRPDRRPLRQRIGRWLDVVAAEGGAARVLAPAVLGLLHDEPWRRWDLDRVRRALLRRPPARRRVRARPDRPDLLADGLAHLLATMTPHDPARLWPTGDSGARTDPCNVQHGAAGVLGVLVGLARSAVHPRADLPAAVDRAADWLVRRLAADPAALPGLYFGRAGAAWALHDAGRLLDRADLVDHAVRLAAALPVRWPNPDVTHGMAGAGLAHLHLWRNTGHDELGRRLVRYVDAVLDAAERTPAGVFWPVPRTFRSRLAGLTHCGFAHGTAGVGWFLLAAARATGRDDCLAAARDAGLTLRDTALLDRDAAFWPAGPGGSGRLPHWCSGSSGAGTFLLRLWRVTGEEQFADLARAAARAVHLTRWRHLPAGCHGLVGNGEFLLDAADLLSEPEHRDRAGDLAEVLSVRHAVVDGRAVLPDETGRAVVADYNVGLAGAVAFLHRLRHGGERLWMADAAVFGPGGAGGAAPAPGRGAAAAGHAAGPTVRPGR